MSNPDGPVTAVPSSRSQLDPITVATIWHGFQRTSREMRHLVERTAQFFLISQLKDISTGLWDAEGNTLAVPVGLTAQFVGGKHSVRYLLREYRGNIFPGDIFLVNDPYHGHTCHVPDWGFFRPIFHQDRLAFFALCRAHMEDTGAAYPGAYFSNPYDVHAEGLLVPGVKIVERGQEQRELLKLIWNNVRLPENVRIDSYAAIAATRLAEERTQALVQRYGLDVVLKSLAEVQDRTEAAVQQAIREIPDGTFQGASVTDDDGVVLGQPVTVRVDVRVAGDRLTLDFSRSDPQQKGYVNATYFTTYSVAVAGAAVFLGSQFADHMNEGLMRAIEVVAPEGSVVNSRYPAPTGGAPVNVGNNVLEAVVMAMSEALPTRAVAAWGRRYGQYTYGRDPKTGQLYVYTGYEAEGGAGATYGNDGYHGTGSFGTFGEIRRPNTEDVEVRYPWRIHRRQFRVDSCGAGRWRGAAGFEWEAENLGEEVGVHTGAGLGETTQGPAASGGQSAPTNIAYIVHDGVRRRAEVHRLHHMEHGDRLIKFTGGGGGVGDPATRDPQAVCDDVFVHELISRAAARDLYRVILDPLTRSVDWDATRRLREAGSVEPSPEGDPGQAPRPNVPPPDVDRRPTVK